MNEVQNHVVTDEEAAAYLRISPSTLRKARCRRSGPPFLKIGKSVRYLVVDLNDWLKSHRIGYEDDDCKKATL